MFVTIRTGDVQAEQPEKRVTSYHRFCACERLLSRGRNADASAFMRSAWGDPLNLTRNQIEADIRAITIAISALSCRYRSRAAGKVISDMCSVVTVWSPVSGVTWRKSALPVRLNPSWI
jgi:hypothetical protein